MFMTVILHFIVTHYQYQYCSSIVYEHSTVITCIRALISKSYFIISCSQIRTCTSAIAAFSDFPYKEMDRVPNTTNSNKCTTKGQRLQSYILSNALTSEYLGDINNIYSFRIKRFILIIQTKC